MKRNVKKQFFFNEHNHVESSFRAEILYTKTGDFIKYIWFKETRECVQEKKTDCVHENRRFDHIGSEISHVQPS